MRIIARLLLASLILAGMCALPACNTLEGFGRDVEATGEAIHHAFHHHHH